MVDASFGEILVTLEKIRWTVAEGEGVLHTEYRGTSLLTVHKTARVEYVPLGVVAAIVSWNYPFHNLLGPVISALFAGNAIVVKVCAVHGMKAGRTGNGRRLTAHAARWCVSTGAGL